MEPATVAQVYALAAAMPARFSALVIVAAFSGLRWGELAALRRCDVDLAAGTVKVPRKLAALRNRLEFGPPKSETSVRTVALPAAALAALRRHTLAHVEPEPEALVFTGAKGAVLRSGNFMRAVKWADSVKAAGIPGRLPLPRSTAHGKHPGGGLWGKHARADAPHGPREYAGRADLPARHQRAGPRDRRRHGSSHHR